MYSLEKMQVMVSIVATLVTLILTIKNDLFKSKLGSESPIYSLNQSKTGFSFNNWLDLSIFQLVGLFVYIVIICSFYVEEMKPLIAILYFLTFILIEVFIYLLWRKGKGELALAIVAGFAIPIYWLSSYGIFYGETWTLNDALVFIIISMILAVIALTCSLYCFGLPIMKNMTTMKRFGLAIVLFIILGITMSIGRKFQGSCYNDYLEKPTERTLVIYDKWKDITNSDKRELYNYISESVIFENSYNDVTEPDTANGPVNVFLGIKGERLSPDQYKNSKIDGYFKDYYDTTVFLRKERIKTIQRTFRSLDDDEKMQFIKNRLHLIHMSDSSIAPKLFNLGYDPSYRVQTTQGIRVIEKDQIISSESTIDDEIFDEFYKSKPGLNPSTRSTYKPPLMANDDDEGLQIPSKYAMYEPNYFKYYKPHQINQELTKISKEFPDELRAQFLLPYELELKIAYKEYLNYAKEILYIKVSRDKYEPIFNGIDSLDLKKYNILTRIVCSDSSYLTVRQVDSIENEYRDEFQKTIQNVTNTQYEQLKEIYRERQNNNSFEPDSNSKLLTLLLKDTTSNKYIDNLLHKYTLSEMKVLMSKSIIDLCIQIHTVDYKERNIQKILQNPILFIAKKRKEVFLNSNSTFNNIDSLSILTYDERKNISNLMSQNLFINEGPYNTNFFQLILYDSTLEGAIISFVVGCIYAMPFTVFILFIVYNLVRLLSRRKATIGVVLDELNANQRQFVNRYSSTSDLLGRDETILNLKALTGRGWSALAIVGRRGIGKTRILHQLLKDTEKSFSDDKVSPQKSASIRAWVSTPTDFSEIEFIRNVLVQVTDCVEAKIADSVNAPHIEVRKLQSEYSQKGILFFVGALMSVGLAANSFLSGRNDNALIIPLVIVVLGVLVSLSMLFIHMSTIQPVDLSRWFEGNRDVNKYTTLLYRETAKIQEEFIKRSNQKGLSKLYYNWKFIAAFSIAVLSTLFFRENRVDSTFLLITTVIFLILTLILTINTVIKHFSNLKPDSNLTLMELVSRYRDYLSKIVSYVKLNALGENVSDYEVVICIDELDKITEHKKLLNLLTKIKVIFEIQGVYYFLSVSEDAYASMYLGAAVGKNEIDSAIDHIIQIPPLKFQHAMAVVDGYVKNAIPEKDRIKYNDPRVKAAIALLSFGVPRDINRIVDQYHSDKMSNDFTKVINLHKFRLLSIAYNERIISYEEMEKWKKENALRTKTDPFNIDTILQMQDHKKSIHILYLYIDDLIEYFVQHHWKEEFTDLNNELMSIGYDLSFEKIETTIERIKNFTGKLKIQ